MTLQSQSKPARERRSRAVISVALDRVDLLSIIGFLREHREYKKELVRKPIIKTLTADRAQCAELQRLIRVLSKGAAC